MVWLSAGIGYVAGSLATGLIILFFLGARGPR